MKPTYLELTAEALDLARTQAVPLENLPGYTRAPRREPALSARMVPANNEGPEGIAYPTTITFPYMQACYREQPVEQDAQQ